MSTVVEKRLCSRHAEATPSLAVYDDGSSHCFGCGYHSGPTDTGRSVGPARVAYKEDIAASLNYIESLPLETIRGQLFHADASRYYITWVGSWFYKSRLKGVEKGDKYRCPVGHKKPLFWATFNFGDETTLIIAEGEINALSIPAGDFAVCSPGPGTDFGDRYAEEMIGYQTYHIFTDEDSAGALAAIKMKTALMNHGVKASNITISLLKKDFNDMLVQDGPERIREELDKVGVPRGL